MFNKILEPRGTGSAHLARFRGDLAFAEKRESNYSKKPRGYDALLDKMAGNDHTKLDNIGI